MAAVREVGPNRREAWLTPLRPAIRAAALPLPSHTPPRARPVRIPAIGARRQLRGPLPRPLDRLHGEQVAPRERGQEYVGGARRRRGGRLRSRARALTPPRPLRTPSSVLLPPSALDRLAAARIDYPMLFEIHSPNSGRTSHCGVMEFVADEGQVYLPNWVRPPRECARRAASAAPPAADRARPGPARGGARADDGEPRAVGERHRAPEELLAAEGHLREAAAGDDGLPGHRQPEGGVRRARRGGRTRLAAREASRGADRAGSRRARPRRPSPSAGSRRTCATSRA